MKNPKNVACLQMCLFLFDITTIFALLLLFAFAIVFVKIITLTIGWFKLSSFFFASISHSLCCCIEGGWCCDADICSAMQKSAGRDWNTHTHTHSQTHIYTYIHTHTFSIKHLCNMKQEKQAFQQHVWEHKQTHTRNLYFTSHIQCCSPNNCKSNNHSSDS